MPATLSILQLGWYDFQPSLLISDATSRPMFWSATPSAFFLKVDALSAGMIEQCRQPL
jgi:hypothetical protein